MRIFSVGPAWLADAVRWGSGAVGRGRLVGRFASPHRVGGRGREIFCLIWDRLAGRIAIKRFVRRLEQFLRPRAWTSPRLEISAALPEGYRVQSCRRLEFDRGVMKGRPQRVRRGVPIGHVIARRLARQPDAEGGRLRPCRTPSRESRWEGGQGAMISQWRVRVPVCAILLLQQCAGRCGSPAGRRRGERWHRGS